MKKLALMAAVMACSVFPVLAETPAKPYLDIREIHTPKGLTVWYVRDETVPVVTLKFSAKGGTQFDAAHKEGTAELLSTLFDEGAGSRDAEEFQDALENHAIRIGFSATRDAFYGNLKTTIGHQDMAVELFDDALNRPHFNQDAIARMKEGLKSNLRFQLMDPNSIASRKLFETLYGDQPYARPVEGTIESLSAITRQDLLAEKAALFCRNNLKIAMVGSLTEHQVARMADRFFGSWRACEKPLSVKMQEPSLDGKMHSVAWQGAQSVLILAQQGLSRQDNDWWAARILDFALGAGQFSSRLMEEVRVKRGLTYGVSSSLMPLDYSPLWVVQAGVDPSKTDEAVSVIRKTWRDVAENGLADDEIQKAKDYLIGSLPLALTSTDAMANIVLQLQEDDLPMNTLDTRKAEISAVTADDIKRVAQRYLTPDKLTIIMVGPTKKKD